MPDPDQHPTGFAVFCGLDVGKSEHHACAVDTNGKRVHDKALPNDESALRTVLSGLAEHGAVLMVIDQPASIGALAIAVARDLGITVAYLPGLAMRRIADLHPGQAKTDARDAHVIAEAARTMPHTLRRVGTDDETLAELTVLAGYDDDLAGQSTRLTNRLRDALLHVHPALERLLGPRLDRGGVLDLLAAALRTRRLWLRLRTGLARRVSMRCGPALIVSVPAAVPRLGRRPGRRWMGRRWMGWGLGNVSGRRKRLGGTASTSTTLSVSGTVSGSTSRSGSGLSVVTVWGTADARPHRAPGAGTARRAGHCAGCPDHPSRNHPHQRR